MLPVFPVLAPLYVLDSLKLQIAVIITPTASLLLIVIPVLTITRTFFSDYCYHYHSVSGAGKRNCSGVLGFKKVAASSGQFGWRD